MNEVLLTDPRPIVLSTLLLLSTSCGTRQVYEDAGFVCTMGYLPWGEAQDPIQIADGDEITLSVIVDECASGSTDWRDQSCTVERGDDGTLTVSSFARSRTPSAQTDDCNVISIPCNNVGALEAGSYTLSYGGFETSFDVPYDGDPICAGPMR